MVELGAIAPYFNAQALNGNPRYCFDSAAGRPIVMLFMGSGQWPPCADALALLARHQALFDDSRASFFGVTVDPTDAADGRIATRIPGIRWFLDYDGRVSQLYKASREEAANKRYEPQWLLLDSALRLVARAPIAEGARIFATLATMIARGPDYDHAPVLVLPRIFEADLCRRLIDLYERHGGSESGFMRQDGDRTVGHVDHSFKRRSDYTIEDAALRDEISTCLSNRLIPQIARAFQFRATRIERWIIACYDSASGGFFRPHRDNTTSGTAHRKFACTINLNTEEHEGGALRFPEFGPRTYRAPTGGAVIFSCSLLHEALPVNSGKRYAFLPFFYDDDGARIRAHNAAKIVLPDQATAAPADGAAPIGAACA